VIQNPLAAYHWRGPRGIGGDSQNAAVAEQATSVAVVVQRDASKAAAVHVGDPIVLRQPFIQESVISLQHIEGTAVIAQERLEKQLRFLAEGLAQIIVEVGKQTQVRS